MIYTYKCPQCEHTEDKKRSVDERHNPVDCRCGAPMRLKITGGNGSLPVLGGGEMPGYYCPVSETFISSRKQRREVMKRHDLVERG